MPGIHRRIVFLALAAAFLFEGGAVRAAQEDPPDPIEMAERIRRGGILSRSEEAYIRRMQEHTGKSRQEVADEIEGIGQRVKESAGVESSVGWGEFVRRRRNGSLNRHEEGDLWSDMGPSLIVLVASSLVVLLFTLLYIWIRSRLADRVHLRGMREGKAADELLFGGLPASEDAPPEMSDKRKTP
jgi:hypothetical protein